VAEVERADEQARNDLVADAEQQGRVEDVVRERDRRPIAIVSRENRLISMPGRPCVTPSHIAGTPPATCAVAPRACAASRMTGGKRSYGWCAESMSL
jgi:hypothetical protein